MSKRTTWAAVTAAILFAPAVMPATPARVGGVDLAVGAPTAATRSQSRPTLRLGDRGPVVQALQERLRAHGRRLTVDGKFGPATRQAVMTFQGDRRLLADGIVGPRTWRELDKAVLSGPLTPIAITRPEPWPTFGTKSYTVRRRDTMESIATATRSTVAALEAANRLNPGARPAVGDTLVVPGNWRCVVPGGKFINDFGFPRAGGRTHKGNDLFAPRGTPVRAPVAGSAEKQDGGLGGRAISLLGDDGHRYYFAHLDRYGTTGRVKAGTLIGYVGNTGNAITTPPHVHFEIHPRGGDVVNPFPTITLACKR